MLFGGICIKINVFLVRSMYEALTCDGHVRQDKLIWKLKVPLKLKFSYGIYEEGLC